jgi:hypothetical protein
MVEEERYMPQTVLQPRHYFSFDNVENRFIKYLLMDVVSTCGKLMERYNRYTSIVAKVKRINEKCKAFLGNELFGGVGEMLMFPDHSQVLVKKDGYRDLFHIYLRLNTALENEKGFEADSAVSMKDMATLWEYYVFIRLMSVLRQKFGNEVKAKYNPDVKGHYGLYDKAVVYFKTGESLEYQHHSISYSNLNWRPDFIFRSAGKSVVLDAKFRIYENNRDDLMKNMHYYKDGLNVDCAVALSFGDQEEGCLFTEDTAQSTLYFKNLNEVLLNTMRGVGYFSLKPILK